MSIRFLFHVCLLLLFANWPAGGNIYRQETLANARQWAAVGCFVGDVIVIDAERLNYSKWFKWKLSYWIFKSSDLCYCVHSSFPFSMADRQTDRVTDTISDGLFASLAFSPLRFDAHRAVCQKVKLQTHQKWSRVHGWLETSLEWPRSQIRSKQRENVYAIIKQR